MSHTHSTDRAAKPAFAPTHELTLTDRTTLDGRSSTFLVQMIGNVLYWRLFGRISPVSGIEGFSARLVRL